MTIRQFKKKNLKNFLFPEFKNSHLRLVLRRKYEPVQNLYLFIFEKFCFISRLMKRRIIN